MNLLIPNGQSLADDLARMMGWEWREVVYAGFHDIDGHSEWHNGECLVGTWKPHENYNQCRIVEDWIYNKMMYMPFVRHLEALLVLEGEIFAIPYTTICRSTPLQRCQSAWLTWKEIK